MNNNTANTNHILYYWSWKSINNYNWYFFSNDICLLLEDSFNNNIKTQKFKKNTLFHDKECLFDYESFKIYDLITNEIICFIRRERNIKISPKTQEIILNCDKKNNNHLYLYFNGNPYNDCSDVIISVTYTYKCRLNSDIKYKKVTITKYPYENIIKMKKDYYVFIYIELSFGNTIITIPLDKSSINTFYEIKTDKQITYPLYISNPYPSYNDYIQNNKTLDNLQNYINNKSMKKVDNIIKEITSIYSNKYLFNTIDNINENTIYSGIPGWSLLLINIYKSNIYPKDYNNTLLELSKSLLLHSLQKSNDYPKDIGFFIGYSGILTMFSITNMYLNDYKSLQDDIKTIFDISNNFSISSNHKYHYEILYGFAGYLSCLLYIKQNISNKYYDNNKLTQIIHKICLILITQSNGEEFTDFIKHKFSYSYYFGAAHGISGILLMVLQVPDFIFSKHSYKTIIINSLDLLISKIDNNGFKSSFDNSSIRYQWCHGSPGLINTLILAYKVFNNNKYLNIAKQLINNIWKYGLLYKGFTLCHGILGNAYAFLQIYKETLNEEYLYYALQFCNSQYNSYIKLNIAGMSNIESKKDYYTLMEGIIGEGYFNIDIQKPLKSLFPTYSI